MTKRIVVMSLFAAACFGQPANDDGEDLVVFPEFRAFYTKLPESTEFLSGTSLDQRRATIGGHDYYLAERQRLPKTDLLSLGGGIGIRATTWLTFKLGLLGVRPLSAKESVFGTEIEHQNTVFTRLQVVEKWKLGYYGEIVFHPHRRVGVGGGAQVSPYEMNFGAGGNQLVQREEVIKAQSRFFYGLLHLQVAGPFGIQLMGGITDEKTGASLTLPHRDPRLMVGAGVTFGPAKRRWETQRDYRQP